MQPPDDSQLCCPSKSLWSLIAQHVSTPELPKIRAVLGNPLVDMYTEEYSEAAAWCKIWREVQPGNSSSSSRAGTPIPHQLCPPLADPPAVKELVRAEVGMLLQTLRERAGRDADELVSRNKHAVVDYALGHRDSSSRNSTDHEDTDNGSRPSSLCSVRSNAEDEIEASKEKLNVIDIDRVAERLKSVLMEECEVLKSLIKCLKRNVKQTCLRKGGESEPSLAELRDLREAVQTQLQLYPSSSPDSPSPSSALPLKELKQLNSFRLSAGRKEALQAGNHASVVRPRPPSPVCRAKPRPPFSSPPTNSPTSVKLIDGSLSHVQHRATSASTEPRRRLTPMCHTIASSGHENTQLGRSAPRPASGQIMGETPSDCRLSPEQDSAGLQCSTQASNHRLQIKTPRIPTVHETHQSSPHRLRGKRGLSPQMERNHGRNITNITSLFPAISLGCDAESYHSNSTDHSVLTSGKPKSHSGPCGAAGVSTMVRPNDATEGAAERFRSRIDSRRDTGISRGQKGPIEKDVSLQQSLVAT